MALDSPIELLIVAVVVIVFLWQGPQKIPLLARALGSAKKEFNEGAKSPASTSMMSTPDAQNGEDLMVAARKLGISTEGKTREQISAEIVRKTAGT